MFKTLKKGALALSAAVIVACGGGGGGGFTVTPTAVFSSDAEARDSVEILLNAVYAPADIGSALETALSTLDIDALIQDLQDLQLDTLSCGNDPAGTVSAVVTPPATLSLTFSNCIDLVQQAVGTVDGTFDGTVELTVVSETPLELDFVFNSFFWDDVEDIDNLNGGLSIRVQTPGSGDQITDVSASSLNFTLNGEVFSYIALTFNAVDGADNRFTSSFSGSYVDADFPDSSDGQPGIVTFSTSDSLVYNNTSGYYEKGTFRINGADGSFIEVTLSDLSCSASVGADYDGDGVLELDDQPWAFDTFGLEAASCPI